MDYLSLLSKKQRESLNIRLHPSRSLLAKGALTQVECLLHKILPRWSRKLRARLDTRSREWFDASKPGTLDGAVRNLIQPGRKYKELVKRYGTGKYERQAGHVTLTGDYSGFYIFLSLDDWIFMPKPDKQLFGNNISISVERKNVEEAPASQWITGAFAKICELMDFMYGFAYHNMDYYSKNMDLTRGGAIGVDPSRYLPGLYWINFFGKPYVELIGKDHLLATPGAVTKMTPAGIIVQFGTEPSAWNTDKYKSMVQDALDHIGRQYFFDRRNIERLTLAPPFVFESIKRDKGQI